MSSTLTSLIYKFFQFLLGEPKLYVLSTFGLISLSIPAIICIVSDASSPIVILPPIVTLPVTSSVPSILTFEFKFISPLDAWKFASNESVSIRLSLIRQSPVSIFVPSIKVVSPLVVNVTPFSVCIWKSLTVNSTAPVSWLI